MMMQWHSCPENPSACLPSKCWDLDASSDANTVATLDATVDANIGAPSFDFMLDDPYSSLEPQFTRETKDSEDLFPELTLPSHIDFDFSQLTPTEHMSSSHISTPFAETFASSPNLEQTPSNLQHDAYGEDLTTGLRLNDPGQRSIIPKSTSRSYPTTSPDRESCQACNKSFLRKHELRYVLQSTRSRVCQCVCS